MSSISIRHDSDDDFSAFISGILGDVDGIKRKALKQIGEVYKAEVIKALPLGDGKYRRRKKSRILSGDDTQTRKHMKEDVLVNVDMKGPYGDQVKVRGGTKTGTLWHLVNDGTSHSRPTHFMDKAQAAAEPEIERILDTELGAEF